MKRLLCRVWGHRWVNGVDVVFGIRVDECSRCLRLRGLMPRRKERAVHRSGGPQ